jgi:hypothetical protein
MCWIQAEIMCECRCGYLTARLRHYSTPGVLAACTPFCVGLFLPLLRMLLHQCRHVGFDGIKRTTRQSLAGTGRRLYSTAQERTAELACSRNVVCPNAVYCVLVSAG